MKLILLHGLGQTIVSWHAVCEKLKEIDVVLYPLFHEINNSDELNLDVLNQQLSLFLRKINEPYILCGLSLGAVLTLQQAVQGSPLLKGFIVSAPQFAPNKFLLIIQTMVFKCLPKKTFDTIGITKKQAIYLMDSIKNLHLQQQLQVITLPAMIICGSKDKVNLKAAKQLATILHNATLRIINNGGHELNSTYPHEFAQEIHHFFIKNQFLPST